MSLLDEVTQIKDQAVERIKNADSLDSLSAIQVKYLGRKGSLTALLKELKNLPIEERKAFGAQANKVRSFIDQAIKDARENLDRPSGAQAIDPTLPGTGCRPGVAHIITQTIDEINHIFHGMGFEIARGPDIETDHFNFEGLNFPAS